MSTVSQISAQGVFWTKEPCPNVNLTPLDWTVTLNFKACNNIFTVDEKVSG